MYPPTEAVFGPGGRTMRYGRLILEDDKSCHGRSGSMLLDGSLNERLRKLLSERDRKRLNLHRFGQNDSRRTTTQRRCNFSGRAASSELSRESKREIQFSMIRTVVRGGLVGLPACV